MVAQRGGDGGFGGVLLFLLAAGALVWFLQGSRTGDGLSLGACPLRVLPAASCVVCQVLHRSAARCSVCYRCACLRYTIIVAILWPCLSGWPNRRAYTISFIIQTHGSPCSYGRWVALDLLPRGR